MLTIWFNRGYTVEDCPSLYDTATIATLAADRYDQELVYGTAIQTLQN